MKNVEGKLEKEKEENIPKRKNIFLQRRKRRKIFGEGKYFFSRGYFSETQGFKVSRSQGLKVSRSQGLKVLRSQGLKDLGSQGLKVSRSQGL